MTLKALQGLLPEYISEMFSVRNSNGHNLRNNNYKLHIDKPKTDFMKKSFSYRAASAWNNLPFDILNGF